MQDATFADTWVVLPDLQRDRQPRGHRGGHPGAPAGRHAAGRRRFLSRWHRRARRPAGCRRPAHPGPPSRGQGRPGQGVHRWLRRRPRGWREAHRPDGRGLVALTRLPATARGRPRRRSGCAPSRRRGPGHRLPVRRRRRCRGLGHRPTRRVAGWLTVRAAGAVAVAARPDGWLQGLAPGGARGRRLGHASTRAATCSRSRPPTSRAAPARASWRCPSCSPTGASGVSKMSRGIIGEALRVVLQLRWDELRGRGPTAHLERPAAPGA